MNNPPPFNRHTAAYNIKTALNDFADEKNYAITFNESTLQNNWIYFKIILNNSRVYNYRIHLYCHDQMKRIVESIGNAIARREHRNEVEQKNKKVRAVATSTIKSFISRHMAKYPYKWFLYSSTTELTLKIMVNGQNCALFTIKKDSFLKKTAQLAKDINGLLAFVEQHPTPHFKIRGCGNKCAYTQPGGDA